ncbi:MAG: sugar nucleotidyltransferase [Bradymonadia bacterium]
MTTKGIVLAGGGGTRMYPLTRAVNKHLLPIYNKPLVYYALSTLLLGGIRDILLVVRPSDLDAYRRLFGDGSEWGISVEYVCQVDAAGIAHALTLAEAFIGNDECALVLGDNLFHGGQLAIQLRHALRKSPGATIFVREVTDPTRYGVVEFDAVGDPVSLVEKPSVPRSNDAITGLYCYDGTVVDKARRLTPSARGELEITDLNRMYLDEGTLTVERLSKDCLWFDIASPNDVFRATQAIASQENQLGQFIGCPEEICWRNGWLSSSGLRTVATAQSETEYRRYLLTLSEQSDASK